jgi:type II secretory ATPase GspE/PulE/Tfp pilus assembly ATPase PilB-like protein
MPRSLPSHPSVRFLQKEAKDLLKAHKGGDSSCCPTLRYHFRFSRAADEEILKAEVSLQEVQHALALDYGLKSWKELKAHVDAQAGPITGGDRTQDLITEMVKIAVGDRASDLHVEPMSNGVKVRYRVDGVLYEMKPLPRDAGQAVVDEIMRLCKLDPDRKDLPQDGRMLVEVDGRKIDIRVSVSPMIHGTAATMRLLDRTQVSLALDRLGMEPEQLELYKTQVHAASGLVLLTGPAGCGKTTTVYASLVSLNDLRSDDRGQVCSEESCDFFRNKVVLTASIGRGGRWGSPQ